MTIVIVGERRADKKKYTIEAETEERVQVRLIRD